MMKAQILVLIVLLALAFGVHYRPTPAVEAVKVSSAKIALVPGPCGDFPGAGCMPTSFSDGYAPTFTSVAPASLPSVINSYDTVVLLQICDIGQYLDDDTWRDPLTDWINAGGKLIIYDSDACGTMTLDYSNFIYPFTTNNPCQCGSSQGTLQDVEDNTLSSTNPADPSYVDLLSIQNNTDAVGDASVMLTQDSHWKGDLKAKNVNGFEGFTHTYAEYGPGLIIYNGLDSDDIGYNANLSKLWELELKQQWDPSNLPGGISVAGNKRLVVFVPGIAQLDQPDQPCKDGTFSNPATDPIWGSLITHAGLLGHVDSLELGTDFRFFSYRGITADGMPEPYSNCDTWRSVFDIAQDFQKQFDVWKTSYDRIDIVAHSLGGVISGYWAGRASAADLAKV